ncbi:LPS export ABC transporter periplasmic protein LptC [Geovibrio thiophilus]|nr:LPS export ABC transporter periplasmic protein LptC [Geovibrio thiophilus]
MGRRFKIILAAAGGVVLLLALFSCSGSDKRVKGYVPPSNVFEITDFEMLTGREGANYRLTAVKASFNRIENIAELTDITVEFEDGEEKITARADRGYYLQNRYLVAEGNIRGKTDDLSFETSESGIMNYDFESYTGTIENDVVCMQGSNTIRADRAEMDFKTKITEFKGNVSISYFM